MDQPHTMTLVAPAVFLALAALAFKLHGWLRDRRTVRRRIQDPDGGVATATEIMIKTQAADAALFDRSYQQARREAQRRK